MARQTEPEDFDHFAPLRDLIPVCSAVTPARNIITKRM
jgi:hypothetical protein